MAGKYPPLEVPSWGVALMFVGFLVFTLLWDKALHALEHRLQHRNKVGLLKVVAGLKEELLAMGLISLLLPFIESYIMQICVPHTWSHASPGYNTKGWASSSTADKGYADKAKDAYAAAKADGGSYGAAKADGGYDAHTTNDAGAHAGRHLLRILMGVAPSVEKVVDEECKPGYIKLYPVEAIHGIHIFIALTAIVHIVYACIAMLLCLWRLKRWQRWELAAAKAPLFVINSRTIKSLGKNKVTHGAAAIINQFTLSVTQPIYAGLRRIMLEQLRKTAGLDYLPVDFPYFEYVRESMEMDFTKVVGVSMLIWLCAIIQLIVPFTYRVWSLIAICSICIALMLAAGAKLHSVVVHLAAHAHFTYGAAAMEEHAEAISAKAEAIDELPSGDLDADVATSKDVDAGVSDGGGGGFINRQAFAQAVPSAVAQAVPDAVGDALGLNTGPRLKRAGNRQADVTARYREYAGRVKATEELAHMFWFDRPGLLLWFYKLAFFQSAFCMTLVFYAFWKDNQFLPDRTTHGGQLIAFLIVLIVNVVLSFYSAMAVLPVYALAQTADPSAVRSATKFLEDNYRHEQARMAHSSSATLEDIADKVQDALSKLKSGARHMAITAQALQDDSTQMIKSTFVRK